MEMRTIYLDENSLPDRYKNHLMEPGERKTEPVKGKVEICIDDYAAHLLGYPGRLLSQHKRAPEGELVYWNSCLFDKDGVQIWFGDINVTKEMEKLKKLAAKVGKLYLTPEHPFRWDGLQAGREEEERLNRIFPKDMKRESRIIEIEVKS